MDREKVLTWLEICGKNNDCSGCCPYSENGFGEYGQCRESLMADAYDLLEEQEGFVSVRFSWLVKFCTHIDFAEPLTDAEREVAWRQKLRQQFGISVP